MGQSSYSAFRNRSGSTRAVAGKAGGVSRLGLILLDRDKRDLAAVVDIGDFYLNLVTDVDDIFDLLDALIAAELGDVNQAVATRGQGDKGTKGNCLHDSTQEALAHLGQLRVCNRVDLLDSSISTTPPVVAET